MAKKLAVAPLLTIPSSRLSSIAFHVVGIQTEGGATPYTGPANAGGSSGISIGVMQNDFGQNRNQTLAYAKAIVNWSNENGQTLSATPEAIAAALNAPPKSGLLNAEMRSAISDFGASTQGADWIYKNFDQEHINTAVLAAQQAFATPYGQAVISAGTHVEEFAAFAMKIRNQYGGGTEGGNGEVRSPGFGALLDYLNDGTVDLKDNQHLGQVRSVVAEHPGEFDRQDLLDFARAYKDTRSTLNEGVYTGPLSALNSGALYRSILDSETTLSDVLKRVEAQGDFSPSLIASDPNVALTRAVFGSDTGRMQRAISAINDDTTVDPLSVSVTLGQYAGTLWVDPFNDRVAISYRGTGQGFVVSEGGYARFDSSLAVKVDGVSTLQIGSGKDRLSFDQAPTPLPHSALPVTSTPAGPVAGHWEDQPVYTAMGDFSGSTESVWVPDPPRTSAPVASIPATATSTPVTTSPIPSTSVADSSATATPKSPTPKAPTPSAQITVVPGEPGQGLAFRLGNNQVVRVGDDLSSPNGQLVSFNRASQTLVLDVQVGDNLYERRTYSANGQVVRQSWQYDTAAPDASTGLPVAYFDGQVVVAGDRAFTFVVGRGLVDSSNGQTAAALGQIEALMQNQGQYTPAPVPVAADPAAGSSTSNPAFAHDYVNGADLQSDAYTPPAPASAPAPSPLIAPDAPTAEPSQQELDAQQISQVFEEVLARNAGSAGSQPSHMTLADAGGGVLTDAGWINGYGGGSTDGDVDGGAGSDGPAHLGSQGAGGGEAPPVAPVVPAAPVLEQVNQAQRATESVVNTTTEATQALVYRQAAASLGLINTLVGLQNWGAQSDLSHASTLVAIYNQIQGLNALSSAGSAAGSLTGAQGFGTLGAGLGLASALQSGNVGSIVANGIALGDVVFEHALSNSIGSSLGISSGNVLPGIGLVLSLEHIEDNPLGVVSAAISMIPGWGPIAGAALSILGGLFGGDEDLPTRQGHAQAQWDANGQLHIQTTQNIENGGGMATAWMNNLAQGLQQQLDQLQGPDGQPLYGLVAPRLPSIGYQYDPDGFNFASAQGHLYLQWTDAQGLTQTRYYDGAGQRTQIGPDGQIDESATQSLVADFMEHAAAAVVPYWQAQTLLAHWQQTQASQGLDVANAQLQQGQASGLPQETQDHLNQILQVLTLDAPPLADVPDVSATVSRWVDVDADGYMERTQWVQANQALLSIDLNNDGAVGADELLQWQGEPGGLGTANNSASANQLGWLDANGDGRLDAQDPAFTALRVWLDVNQDGQNQAGELQTFLQADITAINFVSQPPTVLRADGSRSELTARHLRGDVQGLATAATEGGVLQAQEGGATVLYAANTQIFTDDAAHRHGGQTAAANAPVSIAAGDARLVSTSARALGWVDPAGAGSVAQAQRQATAAMVQSAQSGMFGSGVLDASALVAFAVGAAAVQWPSVVSAAAGPVNQAQDADLAALYGQAESTGQDRPAALATNLPTFGLQQPGWAVEAWPFATLLTNPSVRVDRAVSATALSAYDFQGLYLEGEGLENHSSLAANSVAPLAGVGDSNPVGKLTGAAALDVLASPTTSNAPTTPQAFGPMNDTAVAVQPYVVGERLAGVEDQGFRIAVSSLLANDHSLGLNDTEDFLPSSLRLRISAVGQPVHGQVGLGYNAQGEVEVVFVPEANYHGSASFSYTVTNAYGLSSVDTVEVDLAAVNDAPLAQGEFSSGDEDHVLMFYVADLLANDADVDIARDGDVLHITRVGLAQHGVALINAQGQIAFVPEANYNGPAQFSYWVGDRGGSGAQAGHAPDELESVATMHLTVLPVNDVPLALGESIDSSEDVVLRITPDLLLANDSDVDTADRDPQTLRIAAVGNAQHGTVVLDADGAVTFTPEANYFGAASFRYTVDDGHGGQAQATAVLNLAPVNDAPVVNNEFLNGKRDTTYTLSQAALLANDTDLETPDQLAVVAVQDAQHGQARLNNDGSVTFTPTPGYAGVGSFAYVVQDADGGQSVGTTEIDFSRINQNPLVVDDSFTGFEDTAFIIAANQLLVNDTDPDPTALSRLTVDAVGDATHGQVRLQADGSVRFDPDSNFNGTATFAYRTSDGEGGQTWATAYLTVQSVNDAPVIEAVWRGDPVYNFYVWTFMPSALVVNSEPSFSGYYSYPEWRLQPVSGFEQAQLNVYRTGQTLTFSPDQLGPYTNFGPSLGSKTYGLFTATGAPASYSTYRDGQVQPTGFSALDSVVAISNPLGDGEYGPPTLIPVDAPVIEHGFIKAYDPDGNTAAISFDFQNRPQHGDAWVNAYTPSNSLSTSLVSPVLMPQTGAWQYNSRIGDPYTGPDAFSIRVTDAQGASTVVDITASHLGSSINGGGGGCCPVVVDLAQDGVQLLRPEDSAMFADINNDGWRERIGWAAASDGVLAWDADQDGQITQAQEVSFVDYLPGARTDLEGLAAFDSNGDRQLTSRDTHWAEFGVWQDANRDGRQDAGEWRSLDVMGVTSLSLLREGSARLDQGNVVFGQSQVLWSDGHVSQAADVMFAGEHVPLPGAAVSALAQAATAAPVALLPSTSMPGVVAMSAVVQAPASEPTQEQARIAQMADVFNQWVNTDSFSAGSSPPLGSAASASFVAWSQAADAVVEVPDGLLFGAVSPPNLAVNLAANGSFALRTGSAA